MAQRKIPYLKLVSPPEDPGQVKKQIRAEKWKKAEKVCVFLVILMMALCGTYLLVKNSVYSHAREEESYEKDVTGISSYVQFGKGIVRYNKDGVSYLNRKNEEQWIHPAQFKNPIVRVRGEAFAVADNGGNTILVFTEQGLKGEIETTLPIEDLTVSNQGIVSVILRDGSSPKIFSYDAAGNILVEQKTTMGNTGYPVSLALSEDGKTLAVSYLYVTGSSLQSRIVYYNFGEKGQEKTDNIVAREQYDGQIMAKVFYMGNDCSVAVGDQSFVIFKGKDTPKEYKEVPISQEIKKVFHSKDYIGFILLNDQKSGYEAALYDKKGSLIFHQGFDGEYDHVKLDGDEILLYAGNRFCAITATGIEKFAGELPVNALEIFRAEGLNRYYVMSTSELKMIQLTK